MKKEMDPLVENDTWEFVDCPKNVVIDSHWVLRTMVKADGLKNGFVLVWSRNDMCKRQAFITMRTSALCHATTK